MIICKVLKNDSGESEYPYEVVGIKSGVVIKGFERRDAAKEFAEHLNRQVEKMVK